MSKIDLDKIASRISGKSRTAGKIEFVKDQGPLRRDIRTPGFKWSDESYRDLAKILWSIQRSHSYSMAAYRIFSKMNSSNFSPDGLLGGRGYIQSIKDMRSGLANVSEFLSAFCDTVQDEVNADHWKSGPDKNSENMIEDAKNVRQNPDEFIESEYSELSDEENFSDSEPITNPEPDDLNPDFEDNNDDEEEDDDGIFTTSSSIDKIIKNYKKASSSLPTSTLPGPRVDHIGPGEGNEAGHYNNEDVWPSDDLTGEGLSSGVNESKHLYEDFIVDGVSPYSNPTDGDHVKNKRSLRSLK